MVRIELGIHPFQYIGHGLHSRPYGMVWYVCLNLSKMHLMMTIGPGIHPFQYIGHGLEWYDMV